MLRATLLVLALCCLLPGAEDGTANSALLMPLEHPLSFNLTSAKDGVQFDLDSDGVPEQTAWTARGSKIAFVAIDRDEDGLITRGSELFGRHTVPGAKDGIAALVKLMPHGEGDKERGGIGRIDSHDPIYEKLVLWEDRNHNGISERDELRPLSELYSAIGAGYGSHNVKDAHGNQFRFRGWALWRKGPGNDRPTNRKDEMAVQRDIFEVSFSQH